LGAVFPSPHKRTFLDAKAQEAQAAPDRPSRPSPRVIRARMLSRCQCADSAERAFSAGLLLGEIQEILAPRPPCTCPRPSRPCPRSPSWPPLRSGNRNRRECRETVPAGIRPTVRRSGRLELLLVGMPPQMSKMSVLRVTPMGISTRPGCVTFPTTEKTAVPGLFSVPISRYQDAPFGRSGGPRPVSSRC
jgi:hypothetical protein